MAANDTEILSLFDGVQMPRWLVPDWPAPESVNALVTTRSQGPSQFPYDHLNLAQHVGDDPAMVDACRTWLSHQLGDNRPVLWMDQVHGTDVVDRFPSGDELPKADASVVFDAGYACAVLTADCLPVFFCNRQGTRAGVAHAGWRGLAAGVLENTLAALDCPAEDVMVWLGPAISNEQFEVGGEVFAAFVDQHADDEFAFEPSAYRLGHYMGDLYKLARLRLERAGVSSISGGNFCTASDPRFYSYRRENGKTGRMASVIWLGY